MQLTTLANLVDGLQPLSILDANYAAILQPTPTIITLAGTDLISATSFGDILVNVAGLVTIQLPAASTRTVGGVSIIDIGGNAATYNITILPFGSEKIMGLSSLTIANNYGSWNVYPISTGGWYTK